MHPVLAILWFLPSFVFGVGTVITILALRRAPEGFENEDGFHYLRPSEMPLPMSQRDSTQIVHSGGVGLA